MSPLQEQLSSFPMLTTLRGAGDGVTPAPSPDKPGTALTTQPEQAAVATIESVDDQTAYQVVEQLVRSQDRLVRNRWAIDTYHTWLDAGVSFGRLDKKPNQHIWEAKLPPGMNTEHPAALPNKVNDLNNKVSETLLNDPPKPNPQNHTNGEGQTEAGDLASSFLRTTGGESGTNDVENVRWALRNALPRSTSFLEYDIDPDGGGYQPYQILAHPQATDPNNPLVAQVPDPMTGQVTEIPTEDPILRYVSAQGQFVQNPSEADRVWLPKITVTRRRREQVCLFPATSRIETCSFAIVKGWFTLEEGYKKWPETVGQMDQTQLMNLASWRPAMSDLIVPYTFRSLDTGMTGPPLSQVGSLSPLMQRRMFYYRLYIAPNKAEYPNGLVLDISGANGGTKLGMQNLDFEVPDEQGQTTQKCRDIPICQLTPVMDTADNDPLGWPFDSRFAGSTQATEQLYAAYLDALDRMLRPHVFIRSTTAVDEIDWLDRTQPVILNPTDPEPTYEVIPNPPDIVRVTEDMRTQQNTASGLSATAQGLEDSNSQSGVAKDLTVKQAKVSLSGIHAETMNCFTRGWRIKCQIAQAEFSTPQLLKGAGSGASSEVKWFRGEDLAGVDDIGIEPGTGTLETPEGKANSAMFMQNAGWLTPDQAADVAVTGLSRDLGLPVDAVQEGINRAVTLWLKGPDPMWLQQIRVYNQQAQQMEQQAQAEMAQAQAVGAIPIPRPPMAPPPAPPVQPFAPKPNDSEPMVAVKWVKRLSKLMMSPEYEAQPPEWRQFLDQKYMSCRQATVQNAPTNQPEATYQQFVQDATNKVVQMSNALVAKEVAIASGIAAPPAPPGQPGENGPPKDGESSNGPKAPPPKPALLA